MSTISDTYAEEIIDILKTDTPFLALFEGDPASGGTEVAGGDYERLDPSLGAVSSKQSSNTAEIRWTNMPAADITHVAFYNASTGGTLRLSGPLNSPVSTASGDEFFLSTGNLVVSASGA